MIDKELLNKLSLAHRVIEDQEKEFNKLLVEVNELRNKRKLWHRVCQFERERQKKFYDLMFIDQESDFAMYLAAVKELAEDE